MQKSRRCARPVTSRSDGAGARRLLAPKSPFAQLHACIAPCYATRAVSLRRYPARSRLRAVIFHGGGRPFQHQSALREIIAVRNPAEMMPKPDATAAPSPAWPTAQHIRLSSPGEEVLLSKAAAKTARARAPTSTVPRRAAGHHRKLISRWHQGPEAQSADDHSMGAETRRARNRGRLECAIKFVAPLDTAEKCQRPEEI